MSYVVFNFETTKLYKKPGMFGPASYKTEAAAKAAITRLKKTDPNTDYECCSSEFYFAKIERKVLVKSVMTGKMVEESINTPFSCSVASENYWCS